MNDNKKRVNGLVIASGFAFEVIVVVGVITTLGYFLDRWLHTSPIFLIVFILVGVFAGVYNLIRKINKVE
jgi:ATP synthase protein I